MRNGKGWALAATLLLVLAACGPAATATPAQPTAAPGATPTTGPAGAPTPTATAAPRATTAPTPTASPTPEGPKYGGTIKFPHRTDAVVWDPHKGEGGLSDTRLQHNAVFSRLASRQPVSTCEAQIVPEVAESWRWLNDITLEIKVRQGVRFHNKPPVNGRELTAEDVAYSFNRLKTESNRLTAAMRQVSKFEVVDRYTVRFIGDKPFPQISNEMFTSQYGSVVVPPEAAGGPNKDFNSPALSYIGTGPFMFQEWVPGVRASYKKNPTYFKKGLPYVDGLDMIIMPDHATRAAALRSGKINVWSYELPIVQVEQFQSRPMGVQVVQCPAQAGGGSFARIHLNTETPPLTDVRVRRAITMAIDRDAIIKIAYGGKAFRMGFAPPQAHPFYAKLEDYPPEIRKYLEYHPDEAKALLKEAGATGTKMNIVYTSRYGQPHSMVMEAVVSMLRDVGLDVSFRMVEYGAFADILFSAKQEFMISPPAAWGDPYLDMTAYHSSNPPQLNRSRAKDPAYDKLVDSYLVETDFNKAKELARQIQVRLAEMVYEIRIVGGYDFALLAPDVRDLAFPSTPTVTSDWAERVWLDR